MSYQTTERELFNRLFGFDNSVRALIPPSARKCDTNRASEQIWTPSVDISETNEAFTFQFDLPGLKQEEIDIEFKDDTLLVQGERKTETEEKREGYVRSERYFGKFQRAFTIKTPVDSDSVTATYRNGVLEISLPKAEAIKPKKIAVNAE